MASWAEDNPPESIKPILQKSEKDLTQEEWKQLDRSLRDYLLPVEHSQDYFDATILYHPDDQSTAERLLHKLEGLVLKNRQNVKVQLEEYASNHIQGLLARWEDVLNHSSLLFVLITKNFLADREYSEKATSWLAEIYHRNNEEKSDSFIPVLTRERRALDFKLPALYNQLTPLVFDEGSLSYKYFDKRVCDSLNSKIRFRLRAESQQKVERCKAKRRYWLAHLNPEELTIQPTRERRAEDRIPVEPAGASTCTSQSGLLVSDDDPDEDETPVKDLLMPLQNGDAQVLGHPSQLLVADLRLTLDDIETDISPLAPERDLPNATHDSTSVSSTSRPESEGAMSLTLDDLYAGEACHRYTDGGTLSLPLYQEVSTENGVVGEYCRQPSTTLDECQYASSGQPECFLSVHSRH